MKTLINGRLILPDKQGNFRIVTGAALNFDEKIISIGTCRRRRKNFLGGLT